MIITHSFSHFIFNVVICALRIRGIITQKTIYAVNYIRESHFYQRLVPYRKNTYIEAKITAKVMFPAFQNFKLRIYGKRKRGI
jgi:hypothetical protein